MSPEHHDAGVHDVRRTRPRRRGADVIHNIGYRHYDGPRLGRAYARRSLFSQSLRGAYGLGRSAKSKVLPMLLFAVMCAAGRDHRRGRGRHQGRPSLPVEYTRYADLPAGRHRPLPRGPGPAVRLARPAVQDRHRCTSPAPSSASTTWRAKFAAMAAALFILTAAPAASSSTSARCWRSSTSPTRPRASAQGLVAVAAALAAVRRASAWSSPRSPRAAASASPPIIAVLTISVRRGDRASRAIAYGQGNDRRGRLARAVLADHPDRRRAVAGSSAPAVLDDLPAPAGYGPSRRALAGASSVLPAAWPLAACIAGSLRRC